MPARSVRKCAAHKARQRAPAKLGEAYYRELGVLRETTEHVRELERALGPLPVASEGGQALEIGCGASPYVGAILERGWGYLGVDASPWAVGWVRSRYGVEAEARTFESLPVEPRFGLVLAAHVLEHLVCAPAAIAHMAGMITPGGELWIVVPDDSDPVNPDHLWFWDLSTLLDHLRAAGLAVLGSAMYRIVHHENFLYVRVTNRFDDLVRGGT
jgi:SAM-dependent methyltransferase